MSKNMQYYHEKAPFVVLFSEYLFNKVDDSLKSITDKIDLCIKLKLK